MERREIGAILQDPYAHANNDNEIWAAFDYKGKMCSAVTVTPVTLRINGRDTPTGAIAGVVTRPESRGRGYIGHIMRYAIPNMLANGQVFSLVYPFSFRYYRKFGYEICYPYQQVTIPIEMFNHYPYPSQTEAFSKGDDIAPFMDVYESFTKDRNLSAVRSKEDWTRILNRDPYMDLHFTYLHYDSAGRADSYVFYNPVKENGGHILQIEECCWRTVYGLHRILGLFGKLSSEYEFVRWNAPNDLDIHALFPEPRSIIWNTQPAGMIRIVDVVGALSRLTAPEGVGSLSIGVTDEFLPENTGVYQIKWESGNLSVSQQNDGEVELDTNIETLAQLITGYTSPHEALYSKSAYDKKDKKDKRYEKDKIGTESGEYKVNNEDKLKGKIKEGNRKDKTIDKKLEQLFPSKHLYMMERY